MKKTAILFCSLTLLSYLSFSQNVGVGTTTPHASAALEIQSTSKGMLVPRITLSAANVASPVISPADALLIYNTTTAGIDNNSVSPGFYYWNAATSRWIAISGTATTAGNAGFGVWGDCATNGNISEYNPVADETGAVGDRFGISVSNSGNYAVVGADFDDVGTNVDQGSVSFYRYNGSNWILMQKITDATGAAIDVFGHSVCISGNYAIVGAPLDDAGANVDQGSASIYQYNGTNWVLMQKITDATGAAGDVFGISVSISGNYAIIGAYNDDVGSNADQGSASIYQFNGTNWVLMQKLIDAGGAASDVFGASVSIAGNYVIVGASGDDVGANINQGSASIYQYNGTNWVLMQKITDATGDINDGFGVSVSISGNYVVVGSFFDDIGANADQGSASIYQYNGTSWVSLQKIIDPNGAGGDQFGNTVFISGNYIVIGIPGDDIGANTNQGSANIYQRVGLGWQKLQYLTDPGGNAPDGFGYSISIDETTKQFVSGAAFYTNNSGKVVFGKIN